jgi:hypothetical protein
MIINELYMNYYLYIFYSNEHPITTERQYLSHAKKIESLAKTTYQKYRNYKELASISSSMTMVDFITMYKSLGLPNFQFAKISSSSDSHIERKYRAELVAGLYQLGYELDRQPISNLEFTYRECVAHDKKTEDETKNLKMEIGRNAIVSSLGKREGAKMGCNENLLSEDEKQRKKGKRASALPRTGQNTLAIQSSGIKHFNDPDIENANPSAAAALAMMKDIQQLVNSQTQSQPGNLAVSPSEANINRKVVTCFNCSSQRSGQKLQCYKCGLTTIKCDICESAKELESRECPVCGL